MKIVLALNTPYHEETLDSLRVSLARICDPRVWRVGDKEDFLFEADKVIWISSGLIGKPLVTATHPRVFSLVKALGERVIFVCHKVAPQYWTPLNSDQLVFLTPLATQRYEFPHVYQCESSLTPSARLLEGPYILFVARFTYDHTSSSLKQLVEVCGTLGLKCVIAGEMNELSCKPLSLLLSCKNICLFPNPSNEQLHSLAVYAKALAHLAFPQEESTARYVQQQITGMFTLSLVHSVPLIAHELVLENHCMIGVPFTEEHQLQNAVHYALENQERLKLQLSQYKKRLQELNHRTLSNLVGRRPCWGVSLTVPRRSNLHVCIAYHNFCNYTRLEENLLRQLKWLQGFSNVTVYLSVAYIEKGELPQVDGLCSVFQKHKVESFMFYKEQLYNKILEHLPQEAERLCFLDADIQFASRTWDSDIAQLLDYVDVVQPYTRMGLLGPHGTNVEFYPNALQSDNPKTSRVGLCLAMRKTFLEKLGGFFDLCVLGSGDRVMFSACFGPDHTGNPFLGYKDAHLPNPIQLHAAAQYIRLAQSLSPRTGTVPDDVYHFWHGENRNRQYSDRHRLLKDSLPIRRAEHGLYEWTDSTTAEAAKMYFFSRKEDDIPPDVCVLHKRIIH